MIAPIDKPRLLGSQVAVYGGKGWYIMILSSSIEIRDVMKVLAIAGLV